MKQLLGTILIFFASVSLFATDYFPTENGNSWTFWYRSIFSVVVPNPPVTRDSGTVKWEVVANLATSANSEYIVTLVKQTRSLSRRTVTGTQQSDYDSIFSPARITIDTVTFQQKSMGNALMFSTSDTCPFAIHDPSQTLPNGLSIKDTAVPSLLFFESPVAVKKMISSDCSCFKYRYYSFVLADGIGPMEAYITTCPGLVGGSIHETWWLVNRKYPVGVKNDQAPREHIQSVITFQSNRLYVNLPYSNEVVLSLLDLKGRTIASKVVNGIAMWDLDMEKTLITRGQYIVRITSEKYDNVFKMPFLNYQTRHIF